MSEKTYNKVFSLLVKHRSMYLSQLCALSDLQESQVREILDLLETKNLVRITAKEDPSKEIITIKEAAFAAGRTFGD